MVQSRLFLISNYSPFHSRPWSGEPIYRNGEFCGFVTSTAYGFTLGKQVETILHSYLTII